MKEPKQTLYEGMYIVDSHVADEARNRHFEKIKESIVKKGGEIVKVHDQGRKRLAYQIGHHREGYYYLMYFHLPSDQVKELWREYQLDEKIIRFMTLQTNEVLEDVKFKPLPEQ